MQQFDKQKEGKEKHEIEFGQLGDTSFPFNYYVECTCGFRQETFSLEAAEVVRDIHIAEVVERQTQRT